MAYDVKKAKSIVLDWYKKNEDKTIEVSKKIWEKPEVCWEEFESSKLLEDWLEENGFTVERGVADMPTAFVASYSNGEGPTIGILAEYDGLYNMGHEIATVAKPTGKKGHGCGHNLFGAGSTSAALAVKSAMDQGFIKGTVKLFGCPAEEGGGAKVFMVRDGVFKGVDANITWHPAHANLVPKSSSRAGITLRFNFHGISAHPGTSAHIGRSAVQGVILMEVALNLLRAHVPTQWQFRSIITNPGQDDGLVPPEAEIIVHLRTAERPELDEFIRRVDNCAKGAALATGTTVDMHREMGYSNSIMNDVLSAHALANLHEIGGPEFTEEDYKWAKELNKDVTPAQKAGLMGYMYHIGGDILNEDLYTGVSDDMMVGFVAPYTGDGGDVSWNVPSCQFNISCQTMGSGNHSWQQVVCSGMHIGQAGMLCAGKVIALTAFGFMACPEVVAEAKKEFDAKLATYPYTSPIEKDRKPF